MEAARSRFGLLAMFVCLFVFFVNLRFDWSTAIFLARCHRVFKYFNSFQYCHSCLCKPRKAFLIKSVSPFLNLQSIYLTGPCTASPQAFAVNAFPWRIGHAELWGLGKRELFFAPQPPPLRLTLSLQKLSHFHSSPASTWRTDNFPPQEDRCRRIQPYFPQGFITEIWE